MSLVSAAISTVPLRLVITSETMSGLFPDLVEQIAQHFIGPVISHTGPQRTFQRADERRPLFKGQLRREIRFAFGVVQPNTTIPAENSKAQTMTNHGNSVSHRGIFFNDDMYT